MKKLNEENEGNQERGWRSGAHLDIWISDLDTLNTFGYKTLAPHLSICRMSPFAIEDTRLAT